MNLYESKQLADSMRVVRKNTIAISEELQDKMQPDETNELENIFDH